MVKSSGVTYKFLPKHSIADRSLINHNGAIIPELGVYIRSGSIDSINGSTTGSVTLDFDVSALRLRRIEVFHSGAAALFNTNLNSSTPNSGTSFDPRDVITCYRNVPGSVDFTAGLDQIEDLLAVTDDTVGSEGNIYMKLMPHGSGINSFKYLLFFEAVILYHNRAGEFHK